MNSSLPSFTFQEVLMFQSCVRSAWKTVAVTPGHQRSSAKALRLLQEWSTSRCSLHRPSLAIRRLRGTVTERRTESGRRRRRRCTGNTAIQKVRAGGRRKRALDLRCPISACHTFTECLIHRAPPTAPKSSEMLAVHHRLMKEPSVLSSDGWNDLVWLGFINTEGARRTFHRLRAEQGNRRECKRQR